MSSPNPVLNATPLVGESNVDPNSKSRTVLIALDHSNHSAYAFEWAKENLLNADTDLVVLVNVRPVAIGHASFYEDLSQLVRDIEDENRTSSHRLLQHYGYDLKRLGYLVRAISIRGDTRADTVRKAKEVDATVVVCGSRGLGTLQRAFLGSVSNYIVNHCSCPVLVIRPPIDSDLVRHGHGSKPAEVKATHETAQVTVDQESSPSSPASELVDQLSKEKLCNDPALSTADPSAPTAEGLHAMSA